MADLMALFNGHSDSEDNIKMVLPWPGNKVRSKKEILQVLKRPGENGLDD